MPQNSVLFIGLLPGGFGRLGAKLIGIGLRLLLANSFDDARSIRKIQKVDLAVVDLDYATFDEVEELVRHWGVGVICIHRLPNDELWVRSLAAGAIDCCHADDHGEILQVLVSSPTQGERRRRLIIDQE